MRRRNNITKLTMVIAQQRIEIPISRVKLIFLFLGALAFVAIGLQFVVAPKTINNPVFDPTMISIVGYVSILFFGLTAMFIFRKLFDKSPGLIIDTNGIFDNSSGFSVGQILWSDVEKISVTKINRKRLVSICLKNPQEFISRQENGFKRKLLQLNYKMSDSPLYITSNGLKISFDELLTILSEKFNLYRS